MDDFEKFIQEQKSRLAQERLNVESDPAPLSSPPVAAARNPTARAPWLEAPPSRNVPYENPGDFMEPVQHVPFVQPAFGREATFDEPAPMPLETRRGERKQQDAGDGTGPSLFDKMGTYDVVRKQYLEQKRREYNELPKDGHRRHPSSERTFTDGFQALPPRKTYADPPPAAGRPSRHSQPEGQSDFLDSLFAPKSRRESNNPLRSSQSDFALNEIGRHEDRKVRFQDEVPLVSKDDFLLDTAPRPAPRVRSAPSQEQVHGATLAVGANKNESDEQRKKESYRQDLLRQMEETKRQRQVEKQNDLRVNVTGLPPPAVSPRAPTYVPSFAQKQPLREPPSAMREPVRFNPVSFESPRSFALPPNPARPASPNYKELFERERTALQDILRRPPVTSAPIDFGNLNTPFRLTEAPISPRLSPQPSMALNFAAYEGQRAPAPRVSFNEPFLSQRTPREYYGGPLGGGGAAPPKKEESFPWNNEERSQSRMTQSKRYQQELQQQIREAQQKKQRDKQDLDDYNRKLDAEIANYDPWGRGGAGAPLRDAGGEIKADLRQMKKESDVLETSPRRVQLEAKAALLDVRSSYTSPPNQRKTSDGDSSGYARGGNGIFGQPKSDAEKTATDRYREELKRQIEDRKRQEEENKEKRKIEEEKENKRIEEDQRIIQERLEQEQRQQREKLEMRERELQKEEERRRVAEEQAKETARLKREARRGPKGSETPRASKNEDTKSVKNYPAAVDRRPPSPPIPTLRTKANAQRPPSSRRSRPNTPAQVVRTDEVITNGKSPTPRGGPSPAPSNHRPPPSPTRAPSATVLSQLRTMRKQLESEQRRVESALKRNRDIELEREGTMDIFDIARKREPVRIPRKQPPPMQEPEPGRDLSWTPALESDSAFLNAQDGSTYMFDGKRTPVPTRALPLSREDSFDVDRIEKKNEERLRKLRDIDGTRSSTAADPDDVLNRFLAKQQMQRPLSGESLNDDSWMKAS